MNEPIKQRERLRGNGSIYLRGRVWHYQVYVNGVPDRGTTGETDETRARKFLDRKVKEVFAGTYIPAAMTKVRVSELADNLAQAYKTGILKHNKDVSHTERRWRLHLAPVFGGMYARNVTFQTIAAYVARRQKDEASNASINKELSVLRRAFTFGRKNGTVKEVPPFPERLTENPPRQGLLTDEQYNKLADECGKIGLWLRSLLAVGYTFGWRKNEVKNMRVRQVDLVNRTAELDGTQTKNGKPCKAPLTNETFALLQACVADKKPDDYVFTRPNGEHVKDYRKSWAKCCAAAGVPGFGVHGLRRTMCTNMNEMGIDRKVIMDIGNWKTDDMMTRYNIATDARKAEAMARIDERNKDRVIVIPETNRHRTTHNCTDLEAVESVSKFVS